MSGPNPFGDAPRHSLGLLLVLTPFAVLAAFLCYLLIGTASETLPEKAAQPSGIRYRVTPQEWRDTPPTLRKIHDRYGTASENFPATLAANGNPGSCASPDATVPFGEVIIAISPEGGEHCVEPQRR